MIGVDNWDEGNKDVNARLTLQANAASCLEIETGSMPGPKPWIIQTTAGSTALTRQLGMALAGGQQTLLAAPIDTGTEANPPASWGFVFKPNQTYFLIVTNMAERMSQTRSQQVGLRVTLNAHNTTTTPTPPPMRRRFSTSTPEKPPPGPRGARAEAERTLAATEPGPYGPGAVSWSPEEGGVCGGDWRFHCDGGAKIELGLSPGQDAALSVMAGDASGGMLTQALSVRTFDLFAAEAWIEAVARLPGAAVTLRIPGVDYGFTGTVSDAEIVVSGGDNNPDRISIPPKPLTRWSPCRYGLPNGTVTIEEFSRTLIRGTFKGTLVEGGGVTRLGRRERCPQRSSAGTTSGAFIIAAPWLSDPRTELDFSWVEEQAAAEIGMFMGNEPDPMLPLPESDRPAPAPDGASADAPAGDGTGDPLDHVGCDCSCANAVVMQDKAEQLSQGKGDIDDMAQMGLCWMQCGQAWSGCPD